MSVANWNTRFLAESANGSDMQPDGQGGGPSVCDDPHAAPAQRAEPAPFVGSRVGPYLITKWLGGGGVGEVFKGVDVMLKREVAIKVLRHELATDPIFLERFRREAQLHAKLSHPNVASVHAFLHESDKQFLVMEYVPGISLDEFLRSGGPVPPARAVSIFRRVLDGIEHAHGCGIVHRDIKPANIMLADNGQVKVMDFGIARALDCQENLTRHGQVAGTAKAMSPEQIRGAQADVRSDIYSLGIVLYTLLAGRAPFDGKNDLALMTAQLEQAPPPLHALVDDVPPNLEAAVMRALEKDPRARFQTVRDFSRVIDACLAERTPPAPQSPDRLDGPTSSRTVVNPVLQGAQRLPSAGKGSAPGWKWPRRLWPTSWLRVGAAALALLALAAGAVLWWQAQPGQTTAAAPRDPLVAASHDPLVAASHDPAVAASHDPVTVAPHGTVAAPPPAVPTPPAVEAAAPSETPAPSVPSPVTIAVPPLPGPQPIIEAVKAPTLAIVRLPSDGRVATDPAATHRFKPGERIRLQVATGQDAHVYCYLQDESRQIVRFYPNRFSSGPVRAQAPLSLPGRMPFELVANSAKVVETVACFASERDLMSRLPASVVGTDFEPLAVTSLDEVRSAFEAVAADALAQASFRVEPQ